MRLDFPGPQRIRALYRISPRRTLLVATSITAGVTLVAWGLFGLSLESPTQVSTTGRERASPGSAIALGTTSSTIPATTTSTATASTQPGSVATVPGATTPSGVAGPAWVKESPNGLRLTVTPATSVARTGESINFSALVRDSAGAMRNLTWDFGDGTVKETTPRACSDPVNRPTVTAGRTEYPTEMSHAYRAPGTYQVTVTARTGRGCGSSAPADAVVATGVIRVEGTSQSNGGAQPVVNVSTVKTVLPDDPHLAINVQASDADGFVRSVAISWSSGEAPTVIEYPLTECDDDGGKRWPSSSRSKPLEHTYSVPGTYDVTVTVTSTGCDGSSPQQAIDVLEGLNLGGLATTDLG